MKLTNAVKAVATSIAPSWIRSLLEGRWSNQRARELAARLAVSLNLDELVAIARAAGPYRSNQKQNEILPLLASLAELRPRRVCEIGADRGGTLALFASIAAVDARLISVDIAYPRLRRQCNQAFVGPHQSLTCCEGDSHAMNTRNRVRRWLENDSLDFLFIDGDHSYAGVKADYEMYGPLVRPGGMIAFHDVVPDFRTRFGFKTACDVGEVPRFWRELRQQVPGAYELIEDAEQDGYGIGVIRVPGNQ